MLIRRRNKLVRFVRYALSIFAHSFFSRFLARSILHRAGLFFLAFLHPGADGVTRCPLGVGWSRCTCGLHPGSI